MSLQVLITAGPTREHLDPVRYITNESSGKMGYAIAEACEQKGWDVLLISGPVHLPSPLKKGKLIPVRTALDMHERVMQFTDVDVAIFTAAVADYRPAEIAHQKIKKKDNELNLSLIKNPDIAAEFGKVKTERQISIGFALETENLLQNGEQKLSSKNLDAIVLNDATETGAGFSVDTNRVSILHKDGHLTPYEMKLKSEVAKDIARFIEAITLKNTPALSGN